MARGKKNFVGRPTVITEMVLRKLREAFMVDATDIQACEFAGIGKTALYEYQKENPEFADKKAAWKQHVNFKAKVTIAKDVETNSDLALKVLQVREKDGYSPKTSEGNNYTFNITPAIEFNGEVKIYNIGKKSENVPAV